MKAEWFKGKRVTVFGIGLLGGGVGTIRYLVEQGAHVIATDLKTREQLAASLEQLSGLKNIEYVLGQHRNEDFTRVDMVVKTPGVTWSNKYIALAKKHDIPVETDASLFCLLCPNKIIGVTGTKGKTTTSQMIYHILKNAGYKPLKVGIGKTPVLDRLQYLAKDTIVVFELSSWRLASIGRAKFSPHIAVFTNFMRDHMNYYKTLDAYFKDKSYIYAFQKKDDFCIYNVDDEALAPIAGGTKAHVVPVSTAHDQAAFFVEDGAVKRYVDGEKREIMPVADIPIRGAHHQTNMLLAMGACYTYGMSIQEIVPGVTSFAGVAHRLEHVGNAAGVDYYNDTAATIPGAAVKSIASFERPVILIAGGQDKNLHYEELAEVIATQVKGVVFFKGTATDKIISAVRAVLPEEERDRAFEVVDSMDKAVEIVSRSAAEGDVVLLSPGAASFGIFANEFDRGDQFRALVERLPA